MKKELEQEIMNFLQMVSDENVDDFADKADDLLYKYFKEQVLDLWHHQLISYDTILVKQEREYLERKQNFIRTNDSQSRFIQYFCENDDIADFLDDNIDKVDDIMVILKEFVEARIEKEEK